MSIVAILLIVDTYYTYTLSKKKILMPQSVVHEMLYMKHPTRLKILQGVFLCSNLYVTSPETGAENFSEITDAEAKQLGFPF